MRREARRCSVVKGFVTQTWRTEFGSPESISKHSEHGSSLIIPELRRQKQRTSRIATLDGLVSSEFNLETMPQWIWWRMVKHDFRHHPLISKCTHTCKHIPTYMHTPPHMWICIYIYTYHTFKHMREGRGKMWVLIFTDSYHLEWPGVPLWR